MSKHSLYQPKYLNAGDYLTLRDNTEVNGKIINAYLKLIKRRNQQAQKSKPQKRFPRVFMFSTLFFDNLDKRLSGYLTKDPFTFEANK